MLHFKCETAERLLLGSVRLILRRGMRFIGLMMAYGAARRRAHLAMSGHMASNAADDRALDAAFRHDRSGR